MSLHINAQKGAIAETVLLPGDPLRAKWIANTYLTDVVCYNEVRGMYGFTGYYQGKRISVQGTGMGVPSALIYCHELINDFGVKKMIRLGSAGSCQENIALKDIVIAMASSTTSTLNKAVFPNATFAPIASPKLLLQAMDYCTKENIKPKVGNVLTSDTFYNDDANYYKRWAAHGILCIEMETAALYSIAAKFGIDALSILTISDSILTGAKTTSEEREKTFKTMVEIGLEIS